MLIRNIEPELDKYLESSNYKITFIWGPRRSGKTTLLKKYSRSCKARIFNFDEIADRENFVANREVLKELVASNPIILIDEVQTYPEATVALKILHDEFKVKIVATGSSELRATTQDFDTLAGRYVEVFCLPLSVFEIFDNTSLTKGEQKNFFLKIQEELQLFGGYPEVFAKGETENQKISLLQNILDAYVLKDIIEIYNLKNTKLAKDILTKIALQIGSEVSVREIASSLQANVSTVTNYIEIFIKNYVLIPLPSFKTNLRRAVSENRKLYFADLGIRNILVRDFRPLQLRPDRGSLFENFIVSELEKRRRALHILRNFYFYREYGGKEVDIIIEDYHKQYCALEIKLTVQKAESIFPLEHNLSVLNAKNYQEVILKVLDK